MLLINGDAHDYNEGYINDVDEFCNSNDDITQSLKQNLGLFLGVETSLRRG